MPEMKDTKIIRKVGFFRFGMRVWKEIQDDNCLGWAAALAYSWLFAIFPFLIFLITLTPYLPARAKEHVQKQLEDSIMMTLPTDSAKMVWQTIHRNLEDVLTKPRTGLLSIGLLITLWAASGGMAMTMDALDRAYDVTESRPFYKQRLFAVLITTVVAALILAVIILLPVTSVALLWVEKHLTQWHIPLAALVGVDVGRYALAFALMLTSLAVMYHFGTNIKRRFVLLTPGALFCAVVWLLLGFFFRLYLNHFNSYSKTYGAAGGVVILLMFFYIDAVVLLIGAEINAEIDAAVNGRDETGAVSRNAAEAKPA